MLAGWKAMPTDELLLVLADELWLDAESSRWPAVASLLVERGLKKHDVAALTGMMRVLDDLPSRGAEHEYAAFLADAYSRGPLVTMTALARLQPRTRTHAATAIVRAMLQLAGAQDDEAAGGAWPTRRVPRSAVAADGVAGWEALREAEAAFQPVTAPAERVARSVS